MKKFLKSVFFALTCLFIHPSFAQLSVFYSGMMHPESVISDGKFFYVTDIGRELQPFAKDGDGGVGKFSHEGRLIQKNISHEILHAPKGTAIIKDVLYVADLERVVGIHIPSGEKKISIDFSSFGVQLLNDLAVKDDTTLFASSTDRNKLFEVSLNADGRIKELQIPEIKGANGICYNKEKNRLYVAGLGSFSSNGGEGEIGYIEFTGSKTQYIKLQAITGFFDGIALTDNNSLLVSDWVNLSKAEGIIKEINLTSLEVTIIHSDKIAGPADFYFDNKAGQLIIPETQKGNLLRLPLKQ